MTEITAMVTYAVLAFLVKFFNSMRMIASVSGVASITAVLEVGVSPRLAGLGYSPMFNTTLHRFLIRNRDVK